MTLLLFFVGIRLQFSEIVSRQRLGVAFLVVGLLAR